MNVRVGMKTAFAKVIQITIAPQRSQVKYLHMVCAAGKRETGISDDNWHYDITDDVANGSQILKKSMIGRYVFEVVNYTNRPDLWGCKRVTHRAEHYVYPYK